LVGGISFWDFFLPLSLFFFLVFLPFSSILFSSSFLLWSSENREDQKIKTSTAQEATVKIDQGPPSPEAMMRWVQKNRLLGFLKSGFLRAVESLLLGEGGIRFWCKGGIAEMTPR
jgi:hypothetical protein